MTPLETLQTFDVAHIPSLDVVVLAALDRFSIEPLPKLFFNFKSPLVLGSGNAFIAAQIIFAGSTAVFADESNFETALAESERYDAVVIMSASGAKHAVAMTKVAVRTGLPVHLVTNTADSAVAKLLSDEVVHLFPKNREPYTYNTSTYLGPILAKTGEDVLAIRYYLGQVVSPLLLRNFHDYDAYTFLLPTKFMHLRAMLQTKFDELFGPCVKGRFFTEEEVKHAKTVVVSGNELFISFGVENKYYGLPKNRLYIPILPHCDYGAMMSTTYYIVGKIQTVHPPYFSRSIVAYTKVAANFFGHSIEPIVE